MHFGVSVKAISKIHHPHHRHRYHSHCHHYHLTKQNTCPYEHQHLSLTKILHSILYISSITIPLSPFIPPHPSFPRRCRSYNNLDSGGTSIIPATVQRSYYHFTILKYHHSNHEHNNNNNGNNNNNNKK